MTNDFAGKVGIVTGAGQGIGYEISRQLVAEGAQVLLNDFDEQLAQKAAQSLNTLSGKCIPLAGDAGKVDFIQQMVNVAVEKFGRLDFVVANAGITSFANFLEYQQADFQRVMELNMQGSFFLTQAAVRQMKEQGNGGRIVLMSSVTGVQSHPNLAAYSMTKAAIRMLARTLVLDLSPLGITINAVAPGATLTERTQREEEDYAGIWAKLTPTGRASTPADIAHAVRFLLSPQAAQITGQTILVDGGWSVTSPSPGM